MAWTGPVEASVSTRIAALAPSLQPSEKCVIEVITADRAAAVESTAQEIADRAGVGRTSVIRATQTLGYDGYPQLRVALAREVALNSVHTTAKQSPAGSLKAAIDRFARSLPQLTDALVPEDVEHFVAALDLAPRVVIAAAGLSAPLGLGMAMRLSAAGRSAEYLPDTMSQLIAARSLEPGSVCLVISGSGANQPSLDAADAAHNAGAQVLVLTSFARASLVTKADIALVVPSIGESFSEELVHTSRAALALVLEALVDELVTRRGAKGQQARDEALGLIGSRLRE